MILIINRGGLFMPALYIIVGILFVAYYPAYLLFRCILWPFQKIIPFIHEYPKQSVKVFLGVVVSGLFAYLLDLPYVPHIACSGGIICFLLECFKS